MDCGIVPQLTLRVSGWIVFTPLTLRVSGVELYHPTPSG